jgi:glutathione S-transferase
MMRLYQRTDCPFCWKVRLALVELNIEFETVDTALGEKHEEVMRLSPTGTVPVLVDGDLSIWESGVILDYLDHHYGAGALYPADTAEQCHTRLLHAYSDKVVGGCVKDLVFEKRSKPESQWNAEVIEQSLANWQKCLDWLEPYFSGHFAGHSPDAGLSAADCAIAARLGVAAAYGVAVTSRHPNLYTWYEQVIARPQWQTAYPTSFIRTE